MNDRSAILSKLQIKYINQQIPSYFNQIQTHHTKLHPMSNHFQVQIQLQSNNPRSFTQYKKLPKWISCYRPKVNLNSSEYHFIADPIKGKHQVVTVKNSQSSRPITMYFEIQDPKQIQSQFSLNYRKDQSSLKTFEDIKYAEPEEQIIINQEQTVKDSMWAKKYQPKAFYQLLSEQAHNRNVLTWLKSWDWIVFRKEVPIITPTVKFQKNIINTQTNKSYHQANNQYDHTKLLLLSGPPGCGKTTLARVVARHCGYEVMELNASDDRSGRALIEKIEAMGKNNSVMNGKPTMIIVDEVDGALEQDGNGIKEVLAYIQSGGKKTSEKPQQGHNNHKDRFPKPSDLPKTQYVHHQKHTLIPRPIIFICNDPYVKGLKILRTKAIVVYFRQAEKEKIVKRLKQITQKQKIYIQNDVLGKIADITSCDIRGSLGILQYICQAKRINNQDPKELIVKLRISLQKDSATSINQFVSSLLNETRSSSLKSMPNLKEFSYNFSQIDNKSLLFEMFYNNFSQYKNFFVKRTKESLQLYDYLKWSDQLIQQSFRCGGETDVYLMMLFLYYKTHVVNDERRKVDFPVGFFQRLNKLKQNKQIVHQLVDKWPAYMKSTISLSTVIKEYIWILYYAVQTASNKDSDIIDCVGKMITYGIQLGPRNGYFLFKPEFDSLLVYDNRKLEAQYTTASRNFIEESYEFAKLKSHLLSDMSLAELNKNTEELLSQLNIKNRKRKRNPQSMGKNSIKYKFIEGSGTQITYDLKFKFFFQ